MSHRVFAFAALAGMVAAVSLLGACASQNAADSGGKMHAQLVGNARNAKPDDNLVCFKRTETGTHIAKMYCMTKAQYKAAQREAKKSAQHLKDEIDTQPTPKCNDPNCGGGRLH